MNGMIASTGLRFVAATPLQPTLSVTALHPFPHTPLTMPQHVVLPAQLHPLPGPLPGPAPGPAPQPAPPPASLPMVASQNGNLFADRNDANLHWYLPQFLLADDVDADFAFTATQAHQDKDGHPFNTVRLTLGGRKRQPADVIAFAQANAGAVLREIPFQELTVSLSSTYVDDGGLTQTRVFPGHLQAVDAERLLLVFDQVILGSAVIGVYQDLTLVGSLVLGLTAGFQAWSGSHFIPIDIPPFPRPQPPAALGVVGIRPLPMMAMARMTDPRSLQRIVPPQDPAADAQRVVALAPRPLVQTRQSWSQQVPVALKFHQDAYLLRYTVAPLGAPAHVIRNLADLQSFAGAQSEFTELRSMGNLTERYPSIRRAYLGVLSRSILVVPTRYSILRGRGGCAARCLALVDSASSSGSKCRFQFDFTVAPEISRLDFLQFCQDVAANPDTHGCTVTFASSLRSALPSSLQSTFLSSVTFADGAAPHTVAISAAIHDQDAQFPAVANANLFIDQLRAKGGTGVLGNLSLRLDDGFPDPVDAVVELNFGHTTGSDELAVTLDEAGQQIRLANQSPLDLMVSRYALVAGQAIQTVPATLTVPANANATLPLPAEHTGLSVATEAQLVLPQPFTNARIAQFLDFQTADVAQTQYLLAIDGGGLDLKGITAIVAQIVLTGLPTVQPATLRLDHNVHFDSTHLMVPLANAVFSLPATITLTITPADGAAPATTVTLTHEFSAEPVLILQQGDLVQAPTPP